MCHYASDKRCTDFSLKMHQKRLVAGLRSDPLGELTALPHSGGAYSAPPDLLAAFKG